MRKRTVRNGMRLIMASLVMIVLASFYHAQLSEMFSLSLSSENRMYRLGMFWAAALGGYGVVVTALGCALSPHKNDAQVRIMPLFIGVSAMIVLFFFLLSASFNAPVKEEQRRLRSGETITI